jgi:uncharacterized protein (DUF58 family)
MITWRVPALMVGLGLATVAATAAVEVAPWRPLGVVAVVVALISLLDWLVAAPAGDLQLGRDGPNQVRLGESATVTLRVTNQAVRTMRAVIRDAWVPSAGAAEPYAHVLTLDPGETATIETVLTPTRRGDRPAARVTVRSYGLLGLAYRQTSRRRADAITPPWTLRALPEFRSRRLLPEKLSRLRVIDGQVVTRGRGQGSEFDSLREYVVGDDPRAIDWRGSARREHLVVKQWRPERDRRVLCVLDTGRTSAGRIATTPAFSSPASTLRARTATSPPSRRSHSDTVPNVAEARGEPRLDLAIDAALLLASVAAYAGDRVDLLAIDTHTHANVSASSKRSLPKLIGALAPLQPALVETDFGRVVAEVLDRERKRALVVLFTTLDPGALGEGLLPVLPSLVARHRVVVAAVHDPALDALAAGRDGAAAIHTAAAAERGLAELRRVRAALTRYGVTVVDAPAQDFASAVTDKYLDLKAAGKL